MTTPQLTAAWCRWWLSGVLAVRAREQLEVPRDGADRPPDAILLEHHPLRRPDAHPVAVHQPVGQAAGFGEPLPGQWPGRVALAVLAADHLNHDRVHVPSVPPRP